MFIGSSLEGIEKARIIQAALEDVCESVVWDQAFFEPGQGFLERLTNELDKFDFAVMVFTPDDDLKTRGVEYSAPRDNVLFELGLFIGGLGRSRSFVVHPQGANLHIPTDLLGVSLASYRPPERGTWEAALSPPCQTLRRQISLLGRRQAAPAPTLPPTTPRAEQDFANAVQQRLDENSDILGAMAAPPGLDLWYEQLRPVLGQSAYYNAPTYWLDCNLNILDWNIAFGLLFSDMTPVLQYRHVNEFIARLANYEAVFQHGREFSRRVDRGELPSCDIEPLLHRSATYGDIKLLKVATQLHDPKGHLRGWNVSLFLQQVNWGAYLHDLEAAVEQDKLWSVYAGAYDRILQDFPAYQQLLQDVASAVPDNAASVLDVGAGTGNSTNVLLDKGFNVVSLEQNAAMIDRMRERRFDPIKHRVLKASAEQLNELRSIENETFDAVTLVNVLYGLADPFACLTGIRRVLKPKGVIGLSTTHAAVTLEPLLAAIGRHLVEKGVMDERKEDYEHLCEVNRRIEKTIAKRHTVDEYRAMVQDAGFEIIKSEDFTYCGAVMLIHAKRRS
jgi:ubiquinone/menaquinone biosynthesis C-methylase UbiE